MEGMFGLSPQAVDFDALGIICTDVRTRANLEKILVAFIAGYNAALKDRDHARVSSRLVDEFDAHHVGFAFEGAGMGYALFDLMAPWSASRLRTFTDGAGHKHDYIATVGAGLAVARVPWGRRLLAGYVQKLDPAVAWCVFDGYGFHQGIFQHTRIVDEAAQCAVALPLYARQLFYSGVGRSFWWTQGAFPLRIWQAIECFPRPVRAEMWCGIGVAASYAGGVECDALRELLAASGEWSADFLSGFPFAARMRQKGENASPWTDRACTELLNITAIEAADLVVAGVDEISTQLAGRERDLRERGYGLLRERLLQAVARQRRDKAFSSQTAGMGKAYAAQQ